MTDLRETACGGVKRGKVWCRGGASLRQYRLARGVGSTERRTGISFAHNLSIINFCGVLFNYWPLFGLKNPWIKSSQRSVVSK